MYKVICNCLILSILLIGCKSAPKVDYKANEDVLSNHGEDFKMVNVMAYDDLLNKMSKVDSMETIVEGNVESVCQAKGCWMNVQSDNSNQKMFVKFKDYGFFMPLDLTGGKVVMKGKAYREVTSVDELRHYAEDEGLSKEEVLAIDEPKEELKFMASGVKILKQ